MHYILFACLLLFIAGNLFSQTNQTIFYTVKNGLPSNTLYRTAIDTKGFLWIATEIGLARFDGKKFRNYSTADGLTDNEITDLFIDSSGKVWAIPFRRTPCYYNPGTDRFENDETDKELAKIELATPHRAHILQFGGVAFSNSLRQIFINKENKTTVFSNKLYAKASPPFKMVEYKNDRYLIFAEDSIRSLVNGEIENKQAVNRKILMCESVGNKVYMAAINSIIVYRFDEAGNVTLINEKKFPFELRIFCKTGKRFAITSLNGTTYMLDKNTLEPTEIISATEGVPVRNVLEDNDDNIWLSTMDRGLVKVQKKRISSFDIPELKQNFNAVFKTKNIFAGNNNGEIYRYDGLYAKKLQLNSDKNIDAWVRKIISTNYGIYVSTQSGSFIIDEETFLVKTVFKTNNRSSKAAFLLNDSVILLGGHAYASRYNLKSQKPIDSIAKRVVSLGADAAGNIYIGSNEGLFLWKENKLVNMGEMRKGFSYKINTMAGSPDSLMWIGLGSDSLIIMVNNKWIASLALGGVIQGSVCKSLYCNRAGEVWLGTNKGLNRINYQYSNGKFIFNNTYFGTADGLIGEQVNDIVIQDSLIYVATNEGISYMPAHIQLPISDIPAFITSVSINSKPVELKEKYSLDYNENDISIDFSGVDLTGFIPLFEYSNNDGPWQRTEKIELKKLAPGSYKIKVRAIRRDGKPSAKEGVVLFEISTPFWQSSIFWTVLVLFMFITLLYLQQRSNKLKQKTALEKVLTEKRLTELEMQALKAQINPHFVFNCLNSIKGFIYDKDYAQADKYLDRFSDLMRSTIDNSDASIISLKDEIAYLDNYLQLEKLRFDEKFNYVIDADKNIAAANVFIPAMLLQPYVENAIRHGMRFLENKKGEIKIIVKTGDNFLVCEIDDNGIGREKAAALKSKMHIEYQSRGMNISKRRAELYKIEQEIIDKKDAAGNAEGTKIIVRIPLELKP